MRRTLTIGVEALFARADDREGRRLMRRAPTRAARSARYRRAEERLWASVGVAPSEHWLHLGRNDVTVRVQEVGAGPPVLFLHGGMNSGALWADLAARLEGFRCLLLDRPGCGLSEATGLPLDAIALPRMADALVVDVLDALELETAHLVATSLGGYVALRTAVAHPDRVGRMVQFSWPVGAPHARLPVFMRAMGWMPGLERIAGVLSPGERAVRAMFGRLGLRRSLQEGRIPQELVDCYVALLRDTDTLRNELPATRTLMSSRGGIDQRLLLTDAALAGVGAPTLLLWGENDPFGDAEVARGLVAHMPSAELEVLAGASHAPWLDDPVHVAARTAAFLHG